MDFVYTHAQTDTHKQTHTHTDTYTHTHTHTHTHTQPQTPYITGVLSIMIINRKNNQITLPGVS